MATRRLNDFTVDGNIKATGAINVSAEYDSNHYMRLEANSGGGVLKGLDGGTTKVFIRSYGDSYLTGGNLGINNSSPQDTLHVGGTVRIQNDSDKVLKFVGTSKNTYSFEHDTSRIYIYDETNSAARFTIMDDGNIGIGITSPTNKLHVVGNIYATTNIQCVQTFGNKGTNKGINFENPSTSLQTARIDSDRFRLYFGGTDGVGEAVSFNENGRVGIGTTTPSDKLHVTGRIRTSTDGLALSDTNAVIYRNSNNLELRTYSGYNINLIPANSVGVGTTAAHSGTKVQICGPDTTPSLDTTAIDDASLVLSNSDTDYGTVFATDGSGKGYIQQRRTAVETYYDLLLQPYGGSLGIGTTSPAASLTVQGEGTGGTTSSLILEASGGTDRFNFRDDGTMAWGASATAGKLSWDTNEAIVFGLSGRALNLGSNGTVDRLYIATNGTIGINTDSPSVMLDINGTDAVQLPVGTTAQRPTAAAGMIRYNSTDGSFEGYTDAWGAIGGGDDFSLKSITKNASNQFPITFADSTNFKLSASGTWTITATIASGDVGKSGIILIVNTAATTPGALPSTFKTPNGDNIVWETDSGDYSVLSYFIASTTHVLVNYVGNFS